MKNNLYESDFYSWTKEQLRLLQNSNFDELDIENLKEEIKDLGNNIRDSITSHLKIILLHLLKWKYQEERRSKSWYLSISNSRVEIEDILEDNPGLKSKLDECFKKAYPRAVKKASMETGMPVKIFPKTSIWSLEETLDNDFWPE